LGLKKVQKPRTGRLKQKRKGRLDSGGVFAESRPKRTN